MAVGRSQIIGTSQELTAGLLFVYSEQLVGKWFADAAVVLFVTSLFAALLSFHNAGRAVFFSLGREEVLPSALAKVNTKGALMAGSLAQTAIAVVLIGLFAILGKDPVLSLFAWLTNVGALGVIFLMALAARSRWSSTCVGTARSPRRRARTRRPPWSPRSRSSLCSGWRSPTRRARRDTERPVRWILPGLIVGAPSWAGLRARAEADPARRLRAGRTRRRLGVTDFGTKRSRRM